MKKKAIKDAIEKMNTISAQIRIQAKKVQDIRNEPSLDIEQEKAKTRREQSSIVTQQRGLHAEQCELVKSVQAQRRHVEGTRKYTSQESSSKTVKKLLLIEYHSGR